MDIIIVGCGKVGQNLAVQLNNDGNNITVIDTAASKVNEVIGRHDIMGVVGNGATHLIQQEAGIKKADLLIAVTGSDELNLLCCLIAKKEGNCQTIARVRNPQYSSEARFLKDELGLSFAVNPELAAAQEISRLIQFPTFLKRETFAKGRVELVELQIGEDSRLAGKALFETRMILGNRVLICAVERDGEVFIPNGHFVLQAGDRISVTAARSELVSLIRKLGLLQQKIKNVMIVGCSRIAEYLAEELQKNGVSLKMIDKDEETCRHFAFRFPSALVLHGNASRRGFLESEGIRQTDAVITLTGVDEENLIISMFSSHMGVGKTVTKIDRDEYMRLFVDKGIGSVVCPKDLTANEIVRYVRAMSQSGDESSSVKSLHRIVEGRAEALEFAVPKVAPYVGVPLSKLRLKPNILLACINRGHSVIIPKGTDAMQAGDLVVVVTTADRAIGELGDIFEKDRVEEE